MHQRESIAFERRELLKRGLGALAFALLPSPAFALSERPRSLAFVNTHTREELEATFFLESGYDENALGRIAHVLRDHRTGEVHEIDIQLLELLHALKNSLGTKEPFHVISGYRSLRTNSMLREGGRGVASRSLHLEGRAIDIRIPGVVLEDLHVAALELSRGGVGYYRASSFVHVDTGRVRRW